MLRLDLTSDQPRLRGCATVTSFLAPLNRGHDARIDLVLRGRGPGQQGKGRVKKMVVANKLMTSSYGIPMNVINQLEDRCRLCNVHCSGPLETRLRHQLQINYGFNQS